MRYERQVAQRLTDATSWQIEQTKTAPRLTLSFKDGAEWILSGTETDSTKYGSAGETLFLEIAPETEPPRVYRRVDCLSQATLSDSVRLS